MVLPHFVTGVQKGGDWNRNFALQGKNTDPLGDPRRLSKDDLLHPTFYMEET